MLALLTKKSIRFPQTTTTNTWGTYRPASWPPQVKTVFAPWIVLRWAASSLMFPIVYFPYIDVATDKNQTCVLQKRLPISANSLNLSFHIWRRDLPTSKSRQASCCHRSHFEIAIVFFIPSPSRNGCDDFLAIHILYSTSFNVNILSVHRCTPHHLLHWERIAVPLIPFRGSTFTWKQPIQFF